LADYLDSVPDEDLMAILKCLESVIRSNLQSDRVVVPALETVAGLFEEGVFSRIEHVYKYSLLLLSSPLAFERYLYWHRRLDISRGTYRNCLHVLECISNVDKSKDRYAALLVIESIRQDVTKKLLAMLLHPLPRVRTVKCYIDFR
jgi:hypothetical protein